LHILFALYFLYKKHFIVYTPLTFVIANFVCIVFLAWKKHLIVYNPLTCTWHFCLFAYLGNGEVSTASQPVQHGVLPHKAWSSCKTKCHRGNKTSWCNPGQRFVTFTCTLFITGIFKYDSCSHIVNIIMFFSLYQLLVVWMF